MRRRPERALRPLHAVLLTLHRAALCRPRATLIAALLGMALVATQIPQLHVLLAIDELVDTSLPSTERTRRLKTDFAIGHSWLLVFSPGERGERFTANDLERIAAWVAEERANGELMRVVSPFDLERKRLIGGRVWTLPLLPHLTPAGLEAIQRSPWASILSDGRDVAVELAFPDVEGESRFGRFDPTVAGRLLDRCTEALNLDANEVTVHPVGPVAFEHFSLAGIRQFRVLNLLMLVAILLAFRAVFGTWRAGFLVVGVVGVTGLITYGTMSLAGAPIDYLSTGLFLMLAVAALEDYLFLSYQQLSTGAPAMRCFRNLLVPSLFTSLTTMVGFAALLASDLSIVRRFGTWAAVGALVEWLTTFLLLPAFLRWSRLGRTWVDRNRAWMPRLFGRVASSRLPVPLARLLLLFLPLALVTAGDLNTTDSLTRLFPRDHPHSRALRYLSETRDWTAEVSVVFPAPATRAGTRAILDELRRHPNVARVTDPFEIVRYMTGGLGEPGAFRTVLTDEGQARASLYLRDIDLDALNATFVAVDDTCRDAGCRAAGDLVSYAEYSNKVPAALLSSLTVCLLLVGSIVALLARLVGRGAWIRVLPAAFWGPALMLVVLWVFRIPVNFLTCVFASVLIGLTGDNVIQYLFAGHGEIARGIERRGGASIQVALIMGLACLSFLGSAFVPSRRLGLLLALGFLASLIGDIWIMRSLTRRTG